VPRRGSHRHSGFAVWLSYCWSLRAFPPYHHRCGVVRDRAASSAFYFSRRRPHDSPSARLPPCRCCSESRHGTAKGQRCARTALWMPYNSTVGPSQRPARPVLCQHLFNPTISGARRRTCLDGLSPTADLPTSGLGCQTSLRDLVPPTDSSPQAPGPSPASVWCRACPKPQIRFCTLEQLPTSQVGCLPVPGAGVIGTVPTAWILWLYRLADAVPARAGSFTPTWPS